MRNIAYKAQRELRSAGQSWVDMFSVQHELLYDQDMRDCTNSWFDMWDSHGEGLDNLGRCLILFEDLKAGDYEVS